MILLLVSSGCRRAEGMADIGEGEAIIGTDEEDPQEALSLGFPFPWYQDEHPRRSVPMQRFFLDRYEVRNRDYLPFVRAGHRPPEAWEVVAGEARIPKGKEDHPVGGIEWFDADAYCRWQGKRLPTELEWEKGARGPSGRRYPWGERFDFSRAQVAAGPGGSPGTAPVGSHLSGVSPYGVHDMIGNVAEWTDSWYLPYPGNRTPHPAYGQKNRVIRGGSYLPFGHLSADLYRRVASIYLRTSARSYQPPGERLEDVGFRCAKDG